MPSMSCPEMDVRVEDLGARREEHLQLRVVPLEELLRALEHVFHGRSLRSAVESGPCQTCSSTRTRCARPRCGTRCPFRSAIRSSTPSTTVAGSSSPARSRPTASPRATHGSRCSRSSASASTSCSRRASTASRSTSSSCCAPAASWASPARRCRARSRSSSPTTCARTGSTVSPDRELFIQRRRVKTGAELAGIRRAQRGAEAGMAAARELLRRATPDGAGARRGRRAAHLRAAQGRRRGRPSARTASSAEEFIVSHGAQTAVGHEMGHGPIAPGEPVAARPLPARPGDRLLRRHDAHVRRRRAGRGARRRTSGSAARRSTSRSAAIRPGVAGRDVHTSRPASSSRSTAIPTQLSKKPGEVLEDGFFHALGHGVGLEVHEQPWLGRAPGELVAGDVVAIEPGLYRAGLRRRAARGPRARDGGRRRGAHGLPVRAPP